MQKPIGRENARASAGATALRDALNPYYDFYLHLFLQKLVAVGSAKPLRA
jgi:hypothetical protein